MRISKTRSAFFYFRHWWPRLGSWIQRNEFHTCIHYEFLWLGLSVDQPFEWPERKINTEFIHPPIPVRDFDYQATYEGYEPGEAIGYGRTEREAIDSLRDQVS